MMSFPTVHALTGCLLDEEANAHLLGWGRPPFLLLVQDRPAPSPPHGTRRQIRTVQLPLNTTRMNRYRAGLVDFLPDLAAALRPDRPVVRPTLAACVDLALIAELIADPSPGQRLLAWAVCYEDVLVEADEPHEIRQVEAVDADHRGYQITRWRPHPHPVVFIDEELDPDHEPPIRAALAGLVEATTRSGPPPPAEL